MQHSAVRGSPTPHQGSTVGLQNPGDLRSAVSARSGDLRRARCKESTSRKGYEHEHRPRSVDGLVRSGHVAALSGGRRRRAVARRRTAGAEAGLGACAAAADRVAGRAGARGERLGALDGAQPRRQDLGRAAGVLQGVLRADVALRRRPGHRPGEEAAFAGRSPVLPVGPGAGLRRQVLHRHPVRGRRGTCTCSCTTRPRTRWRSGARSSRVSAARSARWWSGRTDGSTARGPGAIRSASTSTIRNSARWSRISARLGRAIPTAPGAATSWAWTTRTRISPAA